MNRYSFARAVSGCQNIRMQKPTFSDVSTFIRALALTVLAAVATFLSPASGQQASTPDAQQAPASSAAQDSSAASTPAKPDAKATPAKKPTTKTAQTKPAATTDSQASAPAKASTTSGDAASTKPASTAPVGQAGATKTGPAATKTTKPGAGKTATTKATPALTLATPKDKQSYAIGINVGKGLNQNLKQSGVDIDPAILTRAIRDVLSGGKQLMTDQEAQETLKALQAEMRTAQEEKTKQLAEANKKEGDEFLAANKAKEGVNTLPDGLQYKVLQEGTGPKPSATDAVTVNYRGALVNGTEFDSSYKRGQPATFNVTGIIKGWTEALELMPVGSKWQLVIPSDLAYGPSGRPPVIGPNSTLVFEVELVSIQPKPAAPAPAAAPASNPAPAAASPNAAPAPSASAPPKPTPPAPKADPAPAPTPKPPTR
jgi:FKBP-type peptidyl-prolyl cis-trans isomerase FklB